MSFKPNAHPIKFCIVITLFSCIGDDAVMELALALSLQDQDNENFDDDDDDDDDDEDDGDDVDIEDDTDGPLPSERYDSLMQENQPLIGKGFFTTFLLLLKI